MHGEGAELAQALHRVLATLSDLCTHTSVGELGDRIALVQWLGGELAAVDVLLTSAYGRRSAGPAAVAGPARPR